MRIPIGRTLRRACGCIRPIGFDYQGSVDIAGVPTPFSRRHKAPSGKRGLTSNEPVLAAHIFYCYARVMITTIVTPLR